MSQISIDINVDVGEGTNNEAELMPLISSCNIACGGHAGDFNSMREVVKLAKKHQVKIGAHPSFPDKENFGRRVLKIPYTTLFISLKKQINNLLKALREEHIQLHHIKPHGALYNLAAKDKDAAMVIIEVMKSIKLPLRLYVPYGSVIANLAMEENVPITFEAFADRNYNDDLSLVSRTKSNAIIKDPEAMLLHIKNMILNEQVKTISGKLIPIKAETICIHGDNPVAIKLASCLNKRLTNFNIKIQ